MPSDEQHRADCLARFTSAVRAMQSGDKAGVVQYLRDLESRYGREFAESQKAQVLKCAKHPKWKGMA